MKDLMRNLIHADQVGFVSGREGRDNGVIILLLQNKICESGSPTRLLSIEFEKAFDRVDWGFMMSTLEAVGIGPRMISWIRTLYNPPTAMVKINRLLPAPLKCTMEQDRVAPSPHYYLFSH